MGLIQRIRLVLDEAAKAKLVDDSKDAGKKVGDGIDQGAQSGLGKLMGVVKGFAAGLAAAFTVDKIVSFGKASIAAANEAEKGWNALGNTLKNNGVDIDRVRGDVEKLGDAMQESTRFDDDATVGALNKLVQLTGDYSTSLAAIPVAADLAAANNLSLEAASGALGKALAGNTRELKQMMPQLDESGNIMEQVAKKFKDAANNEMKDAEGKTSRMANNFGDLQKAIGAAMIEAGGGTSVIDTFAGVIKGATTWVVDNKEQLVALAKVGITGVTLGFKAVGAVIDFIMPGLKAAGTLIVNLALAYTRAVEGMLSGGARLADAVGLDKFAAKLKAGADAVHQQVLNFQTLLAEKRPAQIAAATDNDTTATKTTSLGGAIAGNVAAGVDKAKDSLSDLERAAERARQNWAKTAADMTRQLNDGIEATATEISGRVAEAIDEISAGMDEEGKKQLAALKARLLDAMKAKDATDQHTITSTQQTVVVTEETEETQQRKRLARMQQWIETINGVAFAVLRIGDSLGVVDAKTAKAINGVADAAIDAVKLGTAIASGNPIGIITSGAAVAGNIIDFGKNLFAKNRDPGRLAANERYYKLALQGDEDALEFLKARSGQFGLIDVEGQGKIEGWGSEKAKADAFTKYEDARKAMEARAAAPSGAGAPLPDGAVTTGTDLPVTVPDAVPETAPWASSRTVMTEMTASHLSGHISSQTTLLREANSHLAIIERLAASLPMIEQFSASIDRNTAATAAAMGNGGLVRTVNEGLGTGYQSEALTSGNAQLPS